MTFNNKTAVITGAGRRLGLFLSQHVLEEGGKVIAITRNTTAELATLAKQYSQLVVLEIHQYSNDTAKAMAKYLTELDVDLLVNNASVYEDDLCFLSDEKADAFSQYEQFFNVHMLFPAALAQGFFTSLQAKKRQGVMINITDIFAENPSDKSALYCSTKAGLESLTQSLAKKYAPIMRVCSIQPGPIKFLPSHSEAQKTKVLSQTLIAEEGGFIPVLQAVKFIVDNHYVTGSAIKVDGGRSLKLS